VSQVLNLKSVITMVQVGKINALSHGRVNLRGHVFGDSK
jgi:hypothetical protein